jgi:biotin carboxylase
MKALAVLLTEASSTSARQALYALGRLGYAIDICDQQPLCLGRFSRYVRAWFRCPPFAAEPQAYVRFLISRLKRRRYDVLIPVHDQVYLLARFRDLLEKYVAVALPPPDSVEQVQSKSAFVKLLDTLVLPHPPTTVVSTAAELRRPCNFPCYIKLAYGTAGTGVWLVRDRQEAEQIASALEAAGLANQEILIQEPARGTFGVTQAVLQHGQLIAAHSYRALAMGVGGSARSRESVLQPVVESHLRQLGSTLQWHGALHIEYFYDSATGQPSYIDANPRLGETLNASLSGTNLCELLVQVSLGRRIAAAPPSRVGVRTHSLLTSLLATAEKSPSRGALVKEVWNACRSGGLYQGSQDELTLPKQDWPSIIPLAAVLLRLLLAPRAARRIVRGAVDDYGLTAAGAERIRSLAK